MRLIPLAAAVLAMLSGMASAKTFGSDVYAIGPGDLPLVGAVLSADIADQDYEIAGCLGGWSQNWHSGNNHMRVEPGIGVYDEGQPGQHLHIRLCPTVQVGAAPPDAVSTGTDPDSSRPPAELFPHDFITPIPAGLTVHAGDLIEVEVDIKGRGYIDGGGELWNKAFALPAGRTGQ